MPSYLRLLVMAVCLCAWAQSDAASVDGGHAAPDPGILLNRVICGRGAAGYLKMLALDSDGMPYGCIQDPSLDWRVVGPIRNPANLHFISIAAAISSEMVVEAIGIAREDGQPYLVTLDQLGGWSAPVALPNPDKKPMADVAMLAIPHLGVQAVCLGRTDGQPYMFAQTQGSGAWRWAGPLANPGQTRFSRVISGESNRNEMDVILLSREDGQPFVVACHTADRDAWGGVEPLPNSDQVPFATAIAATGSDGYTQVVAIGRDDGQPYLIWQDLISGHWSYYGRMLKSTSTSLLAMASGHITNRLGRHMLQLFGVGRTDGQLYRLDHDMNGRWQSLVALTNPTHTPYAAITTATTIESTLDVLCLDRARGTSYQAIETLEPTGTLSWTTVAAVQTPTTMAPPEPLPVFPTAPADPRFLGMWTTADGQRLIVLANGRGTLGNAPLHWFTSGTQCIITYPDGGGQERMTLTSATTAQWIRAGSTTPLMLSRTGTPEGTQDTPRVRAKGNDDF